MNEALNKKHDEYSKASYLFVLIMLGLTLLNVPLKLFGVTRFYFSYIFADLIMGLKFKAAFLIAVLAVAALGAVAIFVRRKAETVYASVLGAVTAADLVILLIRENHINYVLSILAHLWVIYTFIALIVIKYKLRRIS